MRINELGEAHFSEAASALCATTKLEEPDFCAVFNQHTKSWTVSWKWSGDKSPERLHNGVAEYIVPASAQVEYNGELQTWIEKVPYLEELGPQRV